MSNFWVVLWACLGTLAITLIAINLTGGEKCIEKKLPRLYDADDEAFRRSLGSLLGPDLVEGNQVDVLVNEDANLNIIAERLARDMHALFETDWAKASAITLQSWRQRPWRERLVELCARQMRSQL